ncbi:MAG: hypothetical protein H0W48_00555 [Methylibium sp.]|nr:hypothetical protein [Methylibium sp.]
MTIDPSFVGYAMSGTDAGPQLAARMGRAVPIDRTQFVDPLAWYPGSPEPCRRMLIDVPISADDWGVSFPYGIVAVVESVATVSSSGSYPARWAEYWAGDVFYLVPLVLPVGYTPRLRRDWFAYQYAAGSSGYSPFSYTHRTATGLSAPIEWIPSGVVRGTTGGLSTPLADIKYLQDNGLTEHRIIYSVSPGFREVQYRVSWQDRFARAPDWAGTIDVFLRRNADGSHPGAGVNGDTTDVADSLALSDFDNLATSGWHFSEWRSAGALAPSLGVVTNWQAHLSVANMARGSPGMLNILDTYGIVLQLRLSPRVDIPLPYTITGRGGLIAPGGLLA